MTSKAFHEPSHVTRARGSVTYYLEYNLKNNEPGNTTKPSEIVASN